MLHTPAEQKGIFIPTKISDLQEQIGTNKKYLTIVGTFTGDSGDQFETVTHVGSITDVTYPLIKGGLLNLLGNSLPAKIQAVTYQATEQNILTVYW